MKRTLLLAVVAVVALGSAGAHGAIVDQNYDGPDGVLPAGWTADPTYPANVTLETLNNELQNKYTASQPDEDFSYNRVASLDFVSGATATDILKLSFDLRFLTMAGRTGPWTQTNANTTFMVEFGTANATYNLRAGAAGALIIQGGTGGTNPGGVRTWTPGYSSEANVAAGVNVSDGLSYTYSITLDGSTGMQTAEVLNAGGVSQGSYTDGLIWVTDVAAVNQVTFSLPGRLNWMDARLDNLKLEIIPEPATLVVFAIGSAVALLKRRRS